MLLFINFQVTTDTFVASPTPRRALLLSLAATTSERGFGIAKEYRTTTTKTEYKWQKEWEKKKKKRGRLGSQCDPATDIIQGTDIEITVLEILFRTQDY